MPGEHLTVTYRLGTNEHEVKASLADDGDGRGSVVQRCAGMFAGPETILAHLVNDAAPARIATA